MLLQRSQDLCFWTAECLPLACGCLGRICWIDPLGRERLGSGYRVEAGWGDFSSGISGDYDNGSTETQEQTKASCCNWRRDAGEVVSGWLTAEDGQYGPG
jgi:hypothetical protein